MVKQLLIITALLLNVFCAVAQNSVGINTDTPNQNAALDIIPVAGQAQGILIPRLTTAERTGMSLSAEDNGMMVFDSDIGNLFIWNANDWLPVAIEGAAIVHTDGSTIIGDGTSGSPLEVVSGSVAVFNDGTTIAGDGTSGDPLNVNTGTGADQIVQLDGSGDLNLSTATITALSFTGDGSALTNINAINFSGTLAGDVTGTQGATAVGSVGGQTAANIAAAAVLVNGATSLDLDDGDDLTTADVGTGANQIVGLDGSGDLNLSSAAITALSFTGDGSALANINAINFSGTLAGDVTGTQGATAVGSVGGQTAANIAAAAVLVNGATSLDLDDGDDLTTADVGVGPNQLVQLDGSGDLIIGTVDVTAQSYTGNGANLIGITANQVGDVGTGYSGVITDNNSLIGALAELDGAIGAGSLSGLSDVSLGGLSGGEVLQYNGATWDGVFTALGDNGDVTIGAPNPGEVLFYTGSDWANGNIGLADIGDVSLGGLSGGEVLQYNGATWDGVFTALGDNGDVTIGAPNPGEVLFYTGSDWANGNIGLADIGDVSLGGLSGGEVLQYNGATWDGVFTALGDNGDVTIGAPNPGEVLFYTGSDWANGNIGLADIGDVSLGGLSGGEVLQYNGATWDGVFTALGDNGDVTIGAPNPGEVLFYTGSDWANGNIGLADIGDVSLGGLSGGEVLQYNGSDWVNVALGSAASLDVGTGPNQVVQLDGGGDVVANDYLYVSPITKYYGISPIEFGLVLESAADDNVLEANFGSSVIVRSAIEQSGALIAAPVHLPDGATITEVRVVGRNTTSIVATFHFVAKSYSTAVTFDDTGIIPVATSGVAGFTVALGGTRIIDNNSNNYFIYIELPTTAGNLADITGAKISYTITSAN